MIEVKIEPLANKNEWTVIFLGHDMSLSGQENDIGKIVS